MLKATYKWHFKSLSGDGFNSTGTVYADTFDSARDLARQKEFNLVALHRGPLVEADDVDRFKLVVAERDGTGG